MALFGAISFIPLFVQGVLSTDATEAGWSLTPLTLAWVIFSIISGRLILAIGYRKTVMAGMVSLTVGFFFLSRINGAISAGQLTVLMVLIGSGMGLSMISMLIAVQNRFPRHFLGVVTSLIQFFRTLGASVGIAIMGMVMAQKMVSQLSTLASSGQNGTLVYLARYPEMIVNPVDRQNFPASILEPFQNILGAALQDVFFVGFVISLLAFATAFLIPAGSASDHAINP